jgi:hypothetical protein
MKVIKLNINIKTLFFIKVISVITILISGCDINDTRLHIINNTNEPIYYLICDDSSYNQIIAEAKYLKKHHPTDMKCIIQRFNSCLQNAMDTITEASWGETWESKVKKSFEKSIWIFVISDSLSKQEICSDYITKRIYTARLSYNLEYLKKHDWLIVINKEDLLNH